jgi:hypothetical protein
VSPRGIKHCARLSTQSQKEDFHAQNIVVRSTSVLLAGLATAAEKPKYSLTDLGPTGAGGFVVQINRIGLIAGAVTSADGIDNATLWYKKHVIDISKPGLGGTNSLAYATNVFGLAVGAAETGKPDPSGADFCGFKAYGLVTSGDVCAPLPVAERNHESLAHSGW